MSVEGSLTYREIQQYSDYYTLGNEVYLAHPFTDVHYENRLITLAQIIHILSKSFCDIINPTQKDYADYVNMVLCLFDRERYVLLRMYYDENPEIYSDYVNYNELKEDEDCLTEEDMNIAYNILAYFISNFLTIIRIDDQQTREVKLVDLMDETYGFIESTIINMNEYSYNQDNYYSRMAFFVCAPRYYGILAALIAHIMNLIYYQYVSESNKETLMEYIKFLKNISSGILSSGGVVIEE